MDARPPIGVDIRDSSPTRPTSRLNAAARRQREPQAIGDGVIERRRDVSATTPSPDNVTGLRPAEFKVTAIIDTGVYTVNAFSLRLALPAGALNEADLGVLTDRDITMLYPPDVSAGTTSLKVDDLVAGFLGSVIDGTLLAIGVGGPMSCTADDPVTLEGSGGTARSGTWTNSSGAAVKVAHYRSTCIDGEFATFRWYEIFDACGRLQSVTAEEEL